jgi:hypothetical protein
VEISFLTVAKNGHTKCAAKPEWCWQDYNKHWDVLVMKCINSCKGGNLVCGKFTMTVHLLTQPPCVTSSIWTKYSESETSILTTYGFQQFLCSLNLQKNLVWPKVWWYENNELHAMQQLLVIPKTEFKMCFHYWQEWQNKCVCAEEAYFEGKLPCL